MKNVTCEWLRPSRSWQIPISAFFVLVRDKKKTLLAGKFYNDFIDILIEMCLVTLFWAWR